MSEIDEKIKRHLPEEELLLQLAEECAELSQAALKLRRALTGINPTPITEDEARENLQQPNQFLPLPGLPFIAILCRFRLNVPFLVRLRLNSLPCDKIRCPSAARIDWVAVGRSCGCVLRFGAAAGI